MTIKLNSISYAPDAVPAGAVRQRVSVERAGADSGDIGASTSASISDDGRYVVYQSQSDALVDNDNNGAGFADVSDVFLFDRLTNTTVRLSEELNTDRTDGYFGSTNASISGDGRLVVFQSATEDLTDGSNGAHTNGTTQVYLYDVQAGALKEISSETYERNTGDFGAFNPYITRNGNFVVFDSTNESIVDDDGNQGGRDIYVYDTTNNLVERVSGGATLNTNGSSKAQISEGGRHVVYQSVMTDLVTGDNNGAVDIFTYDRLTETTTRITSDRVAGATSWGSSNASMSSDGRFVVFESVSDGLVAEEENYSRDIFVWDREDDSIQRVSSELESDTDGYADSYGASISDDGRYVAYESRNDQLTADDENGVSDVFLFDRTTSTLTRISGLLEDQDPNYFGASNVSITPDGKYVAFEESGEVYRYETSNGTLLRLSPQRTTNATGMEPVITPDGKYVAYASDDDSLDASDENNTTDVFLASADSETKAAIEDGRHLSFDVNISGATSLTVDWGDGTSATVVVPSSGQLHLAHSYAYADFFEGSLSATDASGTHQLGILPVQISGNGVLPRLDGAFLEPELPLALFATGYIQQGDAFEKLFGNEGGDFIFGRAGKQGLYGYDGADLLDAGSGDDILDGGEGGDTLIGGSGSDSYYVDGNSDIIVEGSAVGTDVAYAFSSYALAANAQVEELRLDPLVAMGPINLTGNGFVNKLVGGGGVNVLNGGGGADTMEGGSNSDTYYVDNAGDKVIEGLTGYTDIVIASADWAMRASQQIEVLRTINNSAKTGIDLTGNEFANAITGNAGANKLKGLGANDTLKGGTGADKLTGGKGADDMYAGSDDSSDVFIFTASTDSGTTSKTWDQIFQFDWKKGTEKVSDKIDLSDLDLKWSDIDIATKGDHVKVSVDTHGSSKADMVLQVMDIADLNKADFLL